MDIFCLLCSHLPHVYPFPFFAISTHTSLLFCSYSFFKWWQQFAEGLCGEFWGRVMISSDHLSWEWEYFHLLTLFIFSFALGVHFPWFSEFKRLVSLTEAPNGPCHRSLVLRISGCCLSFYLHWLGSW